MLGSASEADDAVQESWLRLNRSDVSAVDNLAGWLTTVVSRVCLDTLRRRTAARGEDRLPADDVIAGDDPEGEAVLADSVGAALLVVLDTLSPPERLGLRPPRHVRRAVRRDRLDHGVLPRRRAPTRQSRSAPRAWRPRCCTPTR